MDLESVITGLGISEEAREHISPLWEESQAAYPHDGPFFIHPDFIRRVCKDAYISAEIQEMVETAARKITAEPALLALIWHLHYLLYVEPRYASVKKWPVLAASVLKNPAMFYLVGYLSGVPKGRALLAERGVPEEVIKDTLGDLDSRIRRFYAEKGLWGMSPVMVAGWFTLHVTGRIIHLERLQFVPNPKWGGSVRFFRHRKTKEVMGLSEGGMVYRSDGQLNGVDGVKDPSGAWQAELEVGPNQVCGYPMSPYGHALREKRCLARNEWEQIFAPGDFALQVHIPGSGPMDFTQCGRSFQRALEFFPRFFPEWPFKAFACNSWLLDNQLTELLPAHSNLVRFLQEFYLHPSYGSSNDALRWIFGGVPVDLKKAPRKTTLQRAIIDHLLAGGEWHGGSSMLFPQDVNWGEQVYRNQKWVKECR